MKKIGIGYERYKAGIGHEFARQALEQDVSLIDKMKFIHENDLNIPEYAFNWWAHLSLIYYKRQHCNKKEVNCPLHKNDIQLNEECLQK